MDDRVDRVPLEGRGDEIVVPDVADDERQRADRGRMAVAAGRRGRSTSWPAAARWRAVREPM